MSDTGKYPRWFLFLWQRGFLVAFTLLAVSLLVILVAVFHLESRLTDIEGHLEHKAPQRYRPPVPEAGALGDLAGEPLKLGQTLYVPIYSHVYYSGGRPFLLEATLSIRNTDMDSAIVVTAVDYYDTAGKLRRKFLDAPYRLGPLATIEYLVEQRETSGGSGANFIVQWQAKQAVSEPIVEAVMVGTAGAQAISFHSSGKVIHPKGAATP